MKVILVSGKAQHGKDTFATIFKEIAEADGKTVLVAHYADLLKYICRTFYNWNGEKDKKGRTLLQETGVKFRDYDYNFWVNFIINVLAVNNGKWDYVLIPDTRFPNEITRFKVEAAFDVSTVRVVRPNFTSTLSEEQQKHISETALDNYSFDHVASNSGNDLFRLEVGAIYTAIDFQDRKDG